MRGASEIGVLVLIAAMGSLILSGCGDAPVPATWRQAEPQRRPAPRSSVDPNRDPSDSRFSSEAQTRRAAAFRDAAPSSAAWQRLGEPRPGDWLSSFSEPGQTIREHWKSIKNKKTKKRHRLHIAPFADLSPVQRAVLPNLRRFLEAFFDSSVVVRPPRAIDPRFLATERLPQRQYDADRIVNSLKPSVPADSLGVLGLVGGDLFFDDLNFVFGMGLFDYRVGAHSLHRYGVEPKLLLERALKLASHELGHMFGIEHCVFYECIMNGVNSLEELDESSPHLCPICHEKLRRALRFKSKSRYLKLADTYRALDMPDAARFAAARAQ